MPLAVLYLISKIFCLTILRSSDVVSLYNTPTEAHPPKKIHIQTHIHIYTHAYIHAYREKERFICCLLCVCTGKVYKFVQTSKESLALGAISDF